MYDLASRYCKAQRTMLKSESTMSGIHIKKMNEATLIKEVPIWHTHKR